MIKWEATLQTFLETLKNWEKKYLKDADYKFIDPSGSAAAKIEYSQNA